jgi:hypothetical protein
MSGWSAIKCPRTCRQLVRQRLEQSMRENPAAFAQLSPQMRRILPVDLPAVADPGLPPETAP